MTATLAMRKKPSRKLAEPAGIRWARLWEAKAQELDWKGKCPVFSWAAR